MGEQALASLPETSADRMDVDENSQNSPPSSEQVAAPSRPRKASPRSTPSLPKAPLSKEVAQRLLRSTQRPIQRFDSADYFLQLHNEKSKGVSATSSEALQVTETPSTADAEAASDAAANTKRLEEPTPPPPLTLSPGKRRHSAV